MRLIKVGGQSIRSSDSRVRRCDAGNGRRRIVDELDQAMRLTHYMNDLQFFNHVIHQSYRLIGSWTVSMTDKCK
jgi:hypothetical protein